MNIYEQARYAEENIEDAKELRNFQEIAQNENAVHIVPPEDMVEMVVREIMELFGDKSISVFQTKKRLTTILNRHIH